jgi:hypothetical protein
LNKDYKLEFFRNVSHKVILKCNIEKIWKIISTKSCLENYHPFCKRNQTIDWNQKKHVDEIEYLNGKLFRRNFINWYEKKGFDLLINQKNKPYSFVSWRIRSIDKHSEVSIKIHPYLFNKRFKYMNAIPFHVVVKPMLKVYLESVLKGLKIYAEDNKRIKNNHFGRHLWFS